MFLILFDILWYRGECNLIFVREYENVFQIYNWEGKYVDSK